MSIINVPQEKWQHIHIYNVWTWLKINTAQFKSRSGMIKLVADQFLIRIQFCNTFDMKKKFRNLKYLYNFF
jgi:hypothetical protein